MKTVLLDILHEDHPAEDSDHISMQRLTDDHGIELVHDDQMEAVHEEERAANAMGHLSRATNESFECLVGSQRKYNKMVKIFESIVELMRCGG